MISFDSPVYAGKTMMFELEACEFLGIPRGTLNYLLRHGADIPHYSVMARTKMFDKTELLTWWQAHKKNGTAAPEQATPPAVTSVQAKVLKQQQVEQEHLDALSKQKTRPSAKTAS